MMSSFHFVLGRITPAIAIHGNHDVHYHARFPESSCGVLLDTFRPDESSRYGYLPHTIWLSRNRTIVLASFAQRALPSEAWLFPVRAVLLCYEDKPFSPPFTCHVRTIRFLREVVHNPIFILPSVVKIESSVFSSRPVFSRASDARPIPWSIRSSWQRLNSHGTGIHSACGLSSHLSLNCLSQTKLSILGNTQLFRPVRNVRTNGFQPYFIGILVFLQYLPAMHAAARQWCCVSRIRIKELVLSSLYSFTSSPFY